MSGRTGERKGKVFHFILEKFDFVNEIGNFELTMMSIDDDDDSIERTFPEYKYLKIGEFTQYVKQHPDLHKQNL